MNEGSYEEYKKNLYRDHKKHEGLRGGKIRLVVGICLLLYTLYILPFHAENVRDIRGDEIKAGKAYYPQKVYYIENLQILRAKTDTEKNTIYCIAKFLDCRQNDWIILFTPGRDEQLAERIRLSSSLDNELNLTTSGFFQLQYLDALPSAADSFYSVYGGKYADAEGGNMLGLNAEYLCRDDSYTLQILLRPGIPLASLVFGLIGVVSGGFLLFKNRSHKTA